MPDVLIIGGGFAGVWSAASAVRLCRRLGADLTVSLIAPGDELVIRPRLYEAEPAEMQVALDRVLAPIGVERVPATVTVINPASGCVSFTRGGAVDEVSYRRLILASGSMLMRPDLSGAAHLHNVDTLPSAVSLDTHMRELPMEPPTPGRFTAVVVGAGFTGLEVATELVGRLRTLAGPGAGEVRVLLVERANTVGPELGAGPRATILAALRQLSIEVRLNVTVSGVDAGRVWFTDGSEVAARTTVWTAGMVASSLTRQLPGRRDHLGRLLVDQHLRAPEVPGVFVAGDTAAADTGTGRLTLQSCQYAVPLGKFAGHNAAADLLGHPLVPFSPEPYTTCLDLGAIGAVFTTGWERTVRLTGKPAKELKRKINERRIYPPLDQAADILAAADLQRTWAEVA